MYLVLDSCRAALFFQKRVEFLAWSQYAHFAKLEQYHHSVLDDYKTRDLILFSFLLYYLLLEDDFEVELW